MTAPERATGSAPLSAITAVALVRTMRPLQWTKNTVVLAALVFGDKLFALQPVVAAGWATVIFCAWSSAVYLLNDARDAAQDRHHPVKRLRPVAAGLVDPAVAVGVAIVLAVSGLLGALLINPGFAVIGASYLLIMIGYTMWLKAYVIIDVMIIAIGFVLRAVGGAVAIDVAISPWLLACTFLLALFLGFGKRRHELTMFDNASLHRPNLEQYSRASLDTLVLVSAIVAIGSYAFYTVERRGQTGQGLMVLTAPLVAFAVLRYFYLMRQKEAGGRPESTLFADPPLLVAVVLWGIICILVLYIR